MAWIYLAYRWPSEAAWHAALDAEGWANGTPPEVVLSVTGLLREAAFVDPDTGEETSGQVLPGWHVAAAFRDRAAPAAWDALTIEPPAEMPVLGRTPPPSLADYQAAIDAHVEAVARSRAYNGAASCAGYINSTVPSWAAEAAAFVAWRDAVYLGAFAIMGAVQQGAPAPSIAALVAGLPVMEWPT
jgi:hypothetical protein